MEKIILYHNRLNWEVYRAVNNKIVEATANCRSGDGSRLSVLIMEIDILPDDSESVAIEKIKGLYPSVDVEVLK